MKKIEAIPGYLIFFDNVRVDPFVKRFSTHISNDGSINRATIEMIYLPELNRIENVGTISFFEDSIENMTNCKIFVKNVFNNRYELIFDGNIRGKSVSESPNGNSLTYIAIDHMEALTKTIAPLSVPLLASAVEKGLMFRLKSQGIEAENIPDINTYGELNFKDKKIKDILDIIKNNALIHNRIYSDPEGVLSWNDIVGRLYLMGDINERLMESEVLDYRINTNALNAETVYVILNDILQKLMFEFYQDKDGVIRIKPPFWNEKIPLNHVIDSSLIMNYSENCAWERVYSRVLTVGGLTEMEETALGDNTIARDIYTPMGVYKGDISTQGFWSDMRHSASNAANTIDEYDNKFSGYQTGISWLDDKKLVSAWSPSNKGAEWKWPSSGAMRHIGKLGEVTYIGEDNKGNLMIRVKILEGAYKGFEVVYSKLGQISVKVGQRLEHGNIVGYAINYKNKPGAQSAHGTELRIEVRTENYGVSDKYQDFESYETVDPVIYCRDYVTGKDVPTVFNIQVTGIDTMINPSLFEKKYGSSVFSTIQPLIKMQNSQAFASDDAYNALKSYSIFMFNMLNSMANTASLTMIGAPWIRPGVNCWVSPTKYDKVYYVTGVSHHGDPNNGVFTTLTLVHGRDSAVFFSGDTDIFGTLRDSTKGQRDNIFVNETIEGPETFGPVVNNLQHCIEIKQKAKEFHKTSNDGIIKSDRSPYLTYLYGATLKSNTSLSSTKLTSFLFTGHMTLDEIQAKLNEIYLRAPQVVKDRSYKISKVINLAKEKAHKYYISDAFSK